MPPGTERRGRRRLTDEERRQREEQRSIKKASKRAQTVAVVDAAPRAQQASTALSGSQIIQMLNHSQVDSSQDSSACVRFGGPGAWGRPAAPAAPSAPSAVACGSARSVHEFLQESSSDEDETAAASSARAMASMAHDKEHIVTHLRDMAVGSDGLIYPADTQDHCWYCADAFDSVPVMLPVKRQNREFRDTARGCKRFEVDYNFCSFNCAKAWALDRGMLTSVALLGELYRNLTGRSGGIRPAPTLRVLAKFGGRATSGLACGLTVEQFRAEHCPLRLPPDETHSVSRIVQELRAACWPKSVQLHITEKSTVVPRPLPHTQRPAARFRGRYERSAPMQPGTLEAVVSVVPRTGGA